MKTYLVKMNETTVADSRREPLGVYFRHLTANSLSDAMLKAENSWYGKFESVVEKELADGQMLVRDIKDGDSYELLADSSFTNDTVIFKKQGNVIHSTIRGGEFPEVGLFKWYDLSIINLLEGFDEVIPSSLTLEELEWIDFEVYNQVSMFNNIPTKFADIYGEIEL